MDPTRGSRAPTRRRRAPAAVTKRCVSCAAARHRRPCRPRSVRAAGETPRRSRPPPGRRNCECTDPRSYTSEAIEIHTAMLMLVEHCRPPRSPTRAAVEAAAGPTPASAMGSVAPSKSRRRARLRPRPCRLAAPAALLWRFLGPYIDSRGATPPAPLPVVWLGTLRHRFRPAGNRDAMLLQLPGSAREQLRRASDLAPCRWCGCVNRFTPGALPWAPAPPRGSGPRHEGLLPRLRNRYAIGCTVHPYCIHAYII